MTKTMRATLSLMLGLLISTPLLVAAADAEAGRFERNVSRTGPAGNTRHWSHRHETTRDEGRFRRESEHTGPRDGSATAVAEAERTETGAHRTVDRTGPRGNSRTKSGEVERTGDGFTRTVDREAADGNTSNSSYGVQRDSESGTVSRTADHTLPDGSTASKNGSVQQTEDGYTRSAMATGRDGNSMDIEAEANRDAESGEYSRTVSRTPVDYDDGEVAE